MDIKQQKEEQNTVDNAASSDPVVLHTKASAPKQHRTFGNKAFDFIVWPLVQGVAVFWASYYIAKEAMPNGNTWLFKPVRNGTAKILAGMEKILEKPSAIKRYKKYGKAIQKAGRNISLFIF